MKLTWKKQTGQYSHGHDAYSGAVPVGSVSWNGALSRSDSDEVRAARQYVVQFLLPTYGKSQAYDYAPTMERGQKLLADVFAAWLKKADLAQVAS